jgi:hypothetical protein
MRNGELSTWFELGRRLAPVSAPDGNQQSSGLLRLYDEATANCTRTIPIFQRIKG